MVPVGEPAPADRGHGRFGKGFLQAGGGARRAARVLTLAEVPFSALEIRG